MKASKQQAQIGQFRVLDFAAISFRQSLALCKHLLELNLAGPTALYSGCMAGIVVLYAKPFGRNNGLGALPSNYRKGFPSVEMEESHYDLLHCRDKIYAHRDIQGANYTARGVFVPDLHTSRIEIRPSVDGEPRRISTCPSLPDIIPNSIPDIVSLLHFQLERISCAVGNLLIDLAEGRRYPSGIYTIGVDFP